MGYKDSLVSSGSRKPADLHLYLSDGIRFGIPWILANGHQKFFNSYVRVLNRCKRNTSSKADMEFISRVMCFVGDVFCCVEGVDNSFASYISALQYDSANREALQSAIDLIEAYSDAKTKAETQSLLSGAGSLAINYLINTHHIYQHKDWNTPRFLDVADMLASKSPEEAIRTLSSRSGPAAIVWGARAYGAFGDLEAEWQHWRERFRQRGRIALSMTDWFYLSESAWNSPRFWELLIFNRSRLSLGGIPGFSGYRKDRIGPSRLAIYSMSESRSKASKRRSALRDAILSCHHARTMPDLATIQLLRKLYPDWPLPRWIAKIMSKTNTRVSRKDLADIAYPAAYSNIR